MAGGQRGEKESALPDPEAEETTGMGQIANQMVLEMLDKIGRRIKVRKDARSSEKKEKAEEKKGRGR